jgi:CheY-like chemotaxis protein
MIASDSGVMPKARAVTVLFVDDYEDTRLAYAAEAEAAGFGVAVAADGYEALAKAHLTLPDVVVAEAMLYGLDGFELARRLAASPETPAVPVILLTGLLLPSLAIKARHAGCVAVLTKPCPFDVVERVIRRVVGEGAADAQRSA